MNGGMSLASAAVFAWAKTLPWTQVRPLFVGVIGLTTPTLVLTLIHDRSSTSAGGRRWCGWSCSPAHRCRRCSS